MVFPGASFGGMFGAIASNDFGAFMGNWQIIIGLLSLAGFGVAVGFPKWASMILLVLLQYIC